MKHVHWYYTVIGGAAVTVLLFLSFKDSTFRWRQETGIDMLRDLRTLHEIFERIDTTCHIMGFNETKQDINFLNVAQFVGSEIGPMQLEHPAGWQGPYVQQNLTAQGKEYQVVKDVRGFFIVPGDGVKLPNGKVLGKDVVLGGASDISELAKTDLQFHGESLAYPVAMSQYEEHLTVGEELSLGD